MARGTTLVEVAAAEIVRRHTLSDIHSILTAISNHPALIVINLKVTPSFASIDHQWLR